ncbi:MAG: coproporphyrinogen dehydrogenase HemZ [Clostridia bacterium]|nr:coproporphyrinogen dehydrogenase HemZ [Clostridia bacterium]
MLRISAENEKFKYDLSELAKMFLTADEFVMDVRDDGETHPEPDLFVPGDISKNDQKRMLYEFLSQKTGKFLDWGILTGVRPSKLYRELTAQGKETEKVLKEDYFVSDGKLSLLRNVYATQQQASLNMDPNAVGIYVGIPFCPTRCLYCSFTSNKITKKAASAYMDALVKEIWAVKKLMDERGMYVDSIYIGGGTPTSLDDEDFETLLKNVSEAFKGSKTVEFTVEGGRPDTITENKLFLVRKYGADRISINPQTMKQHTLDLIGRSHTPEQIIDAFAIAKASGIPVINADLITGLPEEEPEDFRKSLDSIIDLGPSNITVHTLAVKKASRLIEQDRDYNFRYAQAVREMLDYASQTLAENGYAPYYMYRQKHMAGNFENVGYCKKGTASVYNIRIMEENQTILALGAGGISKQYFPAENRLERVANVSNYEQYIDRIDEMIQRKVEGIVL